MLTNHYLKLLKRLGKSKKKRKNLKKPFKTISTVRLLVRSFLLKKAINLNINIFIKNKF